MRQGAIVGMIRRHGNIVVWEHAIPRDGDLVDQDARGPKMTMFGPSEPATPAGETYGRKYRVRAFVKGKISSIFQQSFGPIDVRDCQIDVVTPFQPEPAAGIVEPTHAELFAWNHGQFVVYPRNAPTDLDGDIALLARDRFTINGQRYIVKGAAVPLQDRNITCVYRVLLGMDPFSTPTLT